MLWADTVLVLLLVFECKVKKLLEILDSTTALIQKKSVRPGERMTFIFCIHAVMAVWGRCVI